MEDEKKQVRTKADLTKTIIGIVLCVVFGFILICNMTIIIKGVVNPDEPPAIFGTRPIVVLSGSMSGEEDGHIEIGDLVFVKDVKFSDLKLGDVVTFKDGGSYTTHRIIGADEKGIITKGDANNTEDMKRLTEDKLVGIVTGRIPKIGNFVLFLQKPLGMLLVVGLPLTAFIIYDILRRQKETKKEDDKTAALEAELERLRALAAGGTAPAPVAEPTAAPVEPVTETAEAPVSETTPEEVEETTETPAEASAEPETENAETPVETPAE